MRRKIGLGIAAFLGILILILDSGTALSGAYDGIQLCLLSIIPSIFPFLILAGILTPLLADISHGTKGIFLVGLLGGYPTGAQITAQLYAQGRLNREDARRLLGFCSNAGPSFIFGILGAKFSTISVVWMLWGIQILSAMLTAVILPGKGKVQIEAGYPCASTVTNSLRRAIHTMGYICGWVVLFRVLLSFLDRWFLWLLPIPARVAVYGILELANGCCSLDLVQSAGLRFILCSGMLAFGGICVAMQTASVVGRLGMGQYIPGKILQTFLSVALASILQGFLFNGDDRVVISPLPAGMILLACILFAVWSRKIKIRGRNPMKIGV